MQIYIKDLSMSIYRRRSIKFLSSFIFILSLLCNAQTKAPDLELGLVQFSSATVFDGKTSHTVPGIVLVVKGKNNGVQSFGITNEAGVLAMPLPPGDYSLAAYTEKGKYVKIERPELIFHVSKNQLTEVGIEILAK